MFMNRLSLWFAVTVGLVAVFTSVSQPHSEGGELFFEFSYDASFDASAGSNAAAAKADFAFVGNYLSSTLRSSVPRDVTMTFTVSGTSDATSQYLGTGGPIFSGAANTFLKASGQTLAQTGRNPLSNGSAVGRATMNFAKSWGYGTEVSGTQYDFRYVVLHELTHALGFTGFITSSGSSATGIYADFDRFLYGWNGTSYQRLVNNSFVPMANAAAAVVNTANPIAFYGPHVAALNGGSAQPMYTPSTFADGSSIYHVNVPSDLMYYQASLGPRSTAYSALDVAILKDLGYSVASQQIAWSGAGASNNWSDVGNWAAGLYPGGNDNALLGNPFTGTAMNLDVTGTLSTLTVSATIPFTLATSNGSALRMTGAEVARTLASSGTQTIATDVVVTTSTTAWDVNGSGKLSVSGGIRQSGVSSLLLKTGTGTLELSGSNAYTAGTTVKAGTLRVTSGGSINHSSANIQIGDASGDQGSLTVAGGSVASSNAIVGFSGTGSLEVAGGSFTAATAYVGYGSTSRGAAVISGGTFSTSGDTHVGFDGAGSMSITGGTLRSNAYWLGTNIGSTGTASLNAGSWSTTSALLVGYSGNGTLSMTGGTLTPGSDVYFGHEASGTGSVSISGGTLTTSFGLYFGHKGTGSMVVTGGSVSSASAFFGNTANSTGIVTVTGGTFNSSSNNTAVGFSGNGSLTVAGNGRFVVAGGNGQLAVAYNVGSRGTVNIGDGGAAGTIMAASISGGAGNAAVVFNHTSTAYAFAPQLTGTLAVSHNGPGTTILSTANSYVGTTTINGGALQFAKTTALYNGNTASWTPANLTTGSGATLAVNVGGAGEFTASNLDTLKAIGTATGGFRAGAFLGIDTTNASGGTFIYSSTISNPNAGQNALGITKLGLGTLVLSGSNSFTGGVQSRAGTLRAGHGKAFGTGAVTLSGGTLDLNGLAVANAIINNGGTLTNAAGYIGSQSIAAVVALSGTIGGVVDVVSGGELKGNTSFSGSVTISSGGIHSPGTSPGAQTFANGLTYAAGSSLTWELAANTDAGYGTNFDALYVSASNLLIGTNALLNLDFDGMDSAVDWSDDFWKTSRTWTIIDFSGPGDSLGLFMLGGSESSWLDSLGMSLATANTTYGRQGSTFSVARSGQDIVLTYTAVPEPSTIMLAGVAACVGCLAYRRTRG
jgi:autotransporter-associated beta strand protein/T5SS/PEP-CTERM-associated repeat protein